ncbi:MAG: hypothetical protein ACU0CI_06590 [Shimia sp.]
MPVKKRWLAAVVKEAKKEQPVHIGRTARVSKPATPDKRRSA